MLASRKARLLLGVAALVCTQAKAGAVPDDDDFDDLDVIVPESDPVDVVTPANPAPKAPKAAKKPHGTYEVMFHTTCSGRRIVYYCW